MAGSQQRIPQSLLCPQFPGAAAHSLQSAAGVMQLIQTCVISCHSLIWVREYLVLHNQTFAQSLKFCV